MGKSMKILTVFLVQLLLLVCVRGDEFPTWCDPGSIQQIRVVISAHFFAQTFITSSRAQGVDRKWCFRIQPSEMTEEVSHISSFIDVPMYVGNLGGYLRVENKIRRDFVPLMAVGRLSPYMVFKHRGVDWSQIEELIISENSTKSVLSKFADSFMREQHQVPLVTEPARKLTNGIPFVDIPWSPNRASVASYATFLYTTFRSKSIFERYRYSSFDVYPLFFLDQTKDIPYNHLMKPILFVNQTWMNKNYNYHRNITLGVMECMIRGAIISRDHSSDYHRIFALHHPFEINIVNFLSWPNNDGFGHIDDSDLTNAVTQFNQMIPGLLPKNFSISFNHSYLQSIQQMMEQNGYDIYGNNTQTVSDIEYLLNPCLYSGDISDSRYFNYCVTHIFDSQRLYLYFLLTFIYIFLCIYGLIQTLALLYYRNQQLVKSRIISAILGCLSVSVCSMFSTVFVILYQVNKVTPYRTILDTDIGAYMVVLAPLYVPFLGSTCAYVFYFLQLIRYFYIRFVYAMMQSINYSSKKRELENGKDLKQSIRKHRMIMSNRVYFLTSIITISLFMLLQIPGIIRLTIANSEALIYISVALTVIARALMSIAFGIILIVDVINNRKNIFKDGSVRFKWFFQYDDPTYFRLEALLECISSLQLLIILVMMVIYIIFTTNDLLTVLQILQVTYLVMQLFLQCGGMVMIIQTKNKITALKSSSKNNISNVVEKIMDDPHGAQLFENFAKNEFSYENVALYKELASFLRNENEQRKIDYDGILGIYDAYMKNNSTLQVNLPHPTVQAVENYLKKDNSEETKVDEKELLLAVYEQVIINLSDTFCRLELTGEYRRYMFVQEKFKEKMMEDITLGDGK